MPMVSRLDLERLAFRIESLQRHSTHGWHPGDELEFQDKLPNGRNTRQRLPQPEDLRNPTKQGGYTEQQYREWNQTILRMDNLVHQNDPRNPQRMIRDMMRGVFRVGRT